MAAIPPTTTSFPSEPSPKPLSNFTKLSPQVRLYTPPSTAPPSPPSAPTTILFCSWMNASPKHIAYYTKYYNSRYPSARIILTTMTTVEFLIHSEARRRSDVAAAVTALLACTDEERIHIHALSNGGAKRVYGILSSYREKTGRPLLAKTLIYDSAPGIPQFKRDVYALSVPGRKMSWVAWVPFIATIYAVTMVVFVSVQWMPRWWWYELVWGPMDGLVNPEVVHKETVQAFIYSKEDAAIDWKDVERYAAGAEKAGYQVKKREVLGAQHVQMFKGKNWGEEGYWGWIEGVWKLALRGDVKGENDV